MSKYIISTIIAFSSFFFISCSSFLKESEVKENACKWYKPSIAERGCENE
jgi:hypothetical protein